MKTLTKPANPFPRHIIDEVTGHTFPDDRWLGWERCQKEMNEYYREALQDPLGFLMSAEEEIAKCLASSFPRRSNLRQALIFVRNAKEKIGEAVNEKEKAK